MKIVQGFLLLALMAAIIFLPGCSVIAGIFSVGMGTAVILVLLVAGLLIYGWKKNSKSQ